MLSSVFQIEEDSDFKKALSLSLSLLSQGELIIVPTETVYGILAPLNLESLAKLSKMKRREENKIVSIHIPSLPSLPQFVSHQKDLGDLIHSLTKKFFPGPLTLVLPRGERVPPFFFPSWERIGIRFSANPFLMCLAKEFGQGLALSSANFSSESPPKNVKQISEDLKKKVSLVIDGGDCSLGVESTVVRPEIVSGEKKIYLLREGYLSYEELLPFGSVVQS